MKTPAAPARWIEGRHRPAAIAGGRAAPTRPAGARAASRSAANSSSPSVCATISGPHPAPRRHPPSGQPELRAVELDEVELRQIMRAEPPPTVPADDGHAVRPRTWFRASPRISSVSTVRTLCPEFAQTGGPGQARAAGTRSWVKGRVAEQENLHREDRPLGKIRRPVLFPLAGFLPLAAVANTQRRSNPEPPPLKRDQPTSMGGFDLS